MLKLEDFGTLDDALTLRRFMDEFKFRDLLATRALYLAPASAFADQREGHYSTLDHQTWDTQFAGWGFDTVGRNRAAQAKAAVARHNQGAVVISCWTTAPADHSRMWRDYGESTQAVMVEATVGRMRDCLGAGFFIVPVQYLDFERESIPKEHVLQPFCYKQKSYGWECEVRVIGSMETGKRVGSPRIEAVNLRALVTRICIHPEAPQSFVDSIQQLTHRELPGTSCAVVENI